MVMSRAGLGANNDGAGEYPTQPNPTRKNSSSRTRLGWVKLDYRELGYIGVGRFAQFSVVMSVRYLVS
jgi:hypothetical protein